MMRAQKILVAVCAMAALALGALPAAAQVTFILSDGSEVQTPQAAYREASRRYVLIDTAKGIQAERAARDVVDVRSPRPAGLDAALQQAANPRTAAEAIPLLEKLVNDNIGLRWDVVAGETLGRLLVAAGRAKEAARICERIVRASKTEWLSVGLQRTYLAALVADGNHLAVQRESEEMLRGGHAAASALAYLARGDSFAAQGQFEAALLDGYLRVLVLYPGVSSIRPEALAKTANVLERMRDPRAGRIRQMLLDEFPRSPFAAGGGV